MKRFLGSDLFLVLLILGQAFCYAAAVGLLTYLVLR
jgi:hypothetical protein